jgi:hypothetical protein
VFAWPLATHDSARTPKTTRRTGGIAKIAKACRWALKDAAGLELPPPAKKKFSDMINSGNAFGSALGQKSAHTSLFLEKLWNHIPPPLPDFVEPMKAKLIGSMPSGDWIYEIKFDGYRALAYAVAVKCGSCRGTKRISVRIFQLDELEASKQSRLRAWNVLQRLRLVLSETGNVAIAQPVQKTFDAEGEALEHALTKSFRVRNEAIRSLCSSVRRFRDVAIKEECKSDYPHALQVLWKALDRAEDLIQDW